MDAKFQDLQREREEQKALEDRLAAMQAKVMRGGTNLLDQEERLREEQRRQEDELRKIAEQEEEITFSAHAPETLGGLEMLKACSAVKPT